MADQNTLTAPLPPALVIRGYLTLIPFARLENGVAMANGVGITVADSINAARADLDRLVARNGGYATPSEGGDLRVVANVCPLIDGYDNWHWDGSRAVLRKMGEDGAVVEEVPLTSTVTFSFDPRADLGQEIAIKGIAA